MGPRLLVPYLAGLDGSLSIPPKLLADLLKRFEDDETQFGELVTPLLLGLVETCREEGLLGRFMASLEAFSALVAHHPLVRKLLVSCDAWKPANVGANEIPRGSLLGGILSVGVDAEDMRSLFSLLPNRETIYVSQLDAAYYTLRTSIHLLVSRTHQTLYGLVKSSAENKEACLDWFAWLAACNDNRLKMHVDPKSVTADRVMVNAYLVLLKFCGPFLSPTSPKLALIDPCHYFCSNRIPGVADASKNNAEAREYAQFVAEQRLPDHKMGSTNFVSECFFLTIQYFRLGPVRMINELMDLLRDLREAQSAVEMFERAEQHRAANPLNALALKNAKQKIQAMKEVKLALDVYLLDPEIIEDSFSLVLVLVAWLQGLLKDKGVEEEEEEEGEGEEIKKKGEKTTTKRKSLFRMLPEFLVESVGEYCLFISRFKPDFWLKHGRPLELLFQLMMSLLDRADLVRNPYLRAKFVDILFGFTDPHLEHLLDVHPVLVEQLAAKMMRFYVEVEITGASSQFYDKFNIRYNISAIFKTVWKGHPVHRQRIIECSADDEMFVRFTNLLLNDVTYLLDESISKLAEIHERQLEMSAPHWASRPVSEQREREHGLATLERQCESYMQLATANLEMLEYLTEDLVKPFLRPELVDRLAAMLCLNMVQMVGPKCSALKVRNPEKYHWQPRRTLSLLIGVLLNMSRGEGFLRALARDTRSFSAATFESAAHVLQRHAIRPSGDIERLRRIAARVTELAAQEANDEETLGDIPEEFLDALMYTVMEEPVRLETSGQVVDRATIVAHLLNDPTDPFNRKPLTMDSVTALPDLKARIQHHLHTRRQQQ